MEYNVRVAVQWPWPWLNTPFDLGDDAYETNCLVPRRI
jgi:hypothetical protein